MTTDPTRIHCGCRKNLAIRLAENLQNINYCLDRDCVPHDEAAQMLEVYPEDLETLVATGLLKSWDGLVRLEDLASFIAEFDWLRRRMELRVFALESAVARRAEVSSAREHVPAMAEVAS